MRRLALLLLCVALTAGCTTTKVPTPAPPPQPPATDRHYASHSSPDLLGWEQGFTVRAEPQWHASIGPLLPDPVGGVWGLQDGALFRFQAKAGAWIDRTTYGRPAPTASGTGELVWLDPGRLLAGQIDLARLVRLRPDGKLEELGPARAPDGAPIRSLRAWDGQLYLWSETGQWYALNAEGGMRPVPAKPWPSDGLTDGGEQDRTALEQATGGQLTSFGGQRIGDAIYGIAVQSRLFTYDLGAAKFAWLGEATAPTARRILGMHDGRILATDSTALVLIDPKTAARTTVAPIGDHPAFYLGAGQVYLDPDRLIDLRTGQTRTLTLPRLSGGVTAVAQSPDGTLFVGTGHGGQLLRIDLAAGKAQDWGRPIPALGQESGEEIAPIDALTFGKDGFLYAVIGSGARATRESHLVRVDPQTGRLLAQTKVSEPIAALTTGADGQVYAAADGRVAVVQADR